MCKQLAAAILWFMILVHLIAARSELSAQPDGPYSKLTPYPKLTQSPKLTPSPTLTNRDRTAPGEVTVESFQGNRLQDLITGVPMGNAAIGEVRTAFGPDEKVLLQGLWEKDAKRAPIIEWQWYGPAGAQLYSSRMTVQHDWRNTWNHYRGPLPMPAGDWTVRLLDEGRPAGTIGFKVVREESAIPVRAMIRAFDESKLTSAQATALARAIRAGLFGEKSAAQVASELPDDVQQRKIQLAIGLFQDGTQLWSRLGSGATFGESTTDALSLMDVMEQLDLTDVDIQLSILHSGIKLAARPARVSGQLHGNTGFSLKIGSRTSTLLPATIFRSNLKTSVDILRQISIDAGAAEDAWNDPGSVLTTFKTQEFILIHGSDEAIELLNGRAVVSPDSLTFDDLHEAVDRAVTWYVTNQQSAGNYLYSFFPSRNVYPTDDWCLRVLNAVFVMTEIANARPDRPEIRASVEQAVDLYAEALQRRGDAAFVHWTQPRADSGLGSTAFLLGSMGMLGRPQDQPDQERMLLAILGQQDDWGRYATSFIGVDRDIDQQFYPGECMLCLMRYYAATHDERARASVARAFDFYRSYWGREKHGPYVPWQVRAFTELHQHTPEQKYADYVFEMMDWLLAEMPPLPLAAGWARAGALQRNLASTGVYTEGLAAAYQLAARVGDEQRIDRYGQALVGCVRYLIGLQFKETDVYPFARPTMVLGALATRPRDNELRLDFTYHGISAVNAVTQFMTAQQWDQLRTKAFP